RARRRRRRLGCAAADVRTHAGAPIAPGARGKERADRLRVRGLLHPRKQGPRRAAEHPLEPIGHARVAGSAAQAARPGRRRDVLRARSGAVGDDAARAGAGDLTPSLPSRPTLEVIRLGGGHSGLDGGPAGLRSSGARLGETVTPGVASALSCHRMRFGLFYQAPEATGQTHADRYAEMFDLIALGDSLGFDVAWLAELHFGGAFSLLASPLMAVPVIAQRTRRIRISTAV